MLVHCKVRGALVQLFLFVTKKTSSVLLNLYLTVFSNLPNILAFDEVFSCSAIAKSSCNVT